VPSPSAPLPSPLARVSLRRLLGLLIAALLVSFSSLPARLGAAGSFVAELVLVVAGALLAVRVAERWLAGERTRKLRPLLLALIAAIALGQIVRSKKLFPLMPYTMYGRAPAGEARYYEYEAELRSGARERFRPSRVIATLGRARIVKGLAREADAIVAAERAGGDAASEQARLRDALGALIAHHNLRHASDPVIAVDVIEVTLPAPYLPSGARRHTLLSVPRREAP